MRTHAYRTFELLAWPAAVVASLEVVFLMVTASTAGLAETLLVSACATGTITASQLRRSALKYQRNLLP